MRSKFTVFTVPQDLAYLSSINLQVRHFYLAICAISRIEKRERISFHTIYAVCKSIAVVDIHHTNTVISDYRYIKSRLLKPIFHIRIEHRKLVNVLIRITVFHKPYPVFVLSLAANAYAICIVILAVDKAQAELSVVRAAHGERNTVCRIQARKRYFVSRSQVEISSCLCVARFVMIGFCLVLGLPVRLCLYLPFQNIRALHLD